MIKRNLIAIIIAIVVTVVLGVPAAFYGGYCHCMTALNLVFPYSNVIVMRTSWESKGDVLTLLQFPIYAVIIANLNGRRARLVGATAILVVHVIAAIMAVILVP